MMQMLAKRWMQVTILLLLLITAASVRFLSPPLIMQMQDHVFDAYNRAMPRDREGRYNDVVIIDIDEESLKRIGQWPWPRSLIGDMPLIARSMGARSVAFDMVFSEPDRLSPSRVADNLPATAELAPVAEALRKLPDNDEVLAQKIAQAGNVVAGFVGSQTPTDGVPLRKAQLCGAANPPFTDGHPAPPVRRMRYFVASLPKVAEAAAGNGIFTAEPAEDGVIREVPLLMARAVPSGDGKYAVVDILPTLSLEALRVANSDANAMLAQNGICPGYGVDIDPSGVIDGVRLGRAFVPTDGQGAIRVYYHGHRPEMYVPAWKVLDKTIDPAVFKDKIVLIGTSSIGLLDLRSSPLNKVVPGVEMHAEIIEQFLHKQFLIRDAAARSYELLFAVIVCLLIIWLTPFISGGLMALLVFLTLLGCAAASVVAYQHGYLVDAVYPSVLIAVIFVMSSILTNLRTEMEKRMIRQAFDRYLSPALIEELVKDPSRLKLGGDVRELSVMFTDIRNFTTISETMDPAELIRMMNDFLTPMTSAVLDNKGFVDKYMGDAMMTFWNAPVDDPNHARNACKAALEMVEALKPVNAELRSRAEKAGRPFYELKAGIGINSGRASVGNMGSKQRFAYSALGDTVNLASRLEGQTKAYGITAMISHATRQQVPEFAVIELDLLTVKGRTEPERVYALLGDEKLAQTPEFRDFVALHDRMLAAYRTQKWEEALKLMAECAGLRLDLAALYHLYAERIGYYKEHPPGPGWAGVWVAKEK